MALVPPSPAATCPHEMQQHGEEQEDLTGTGMGYGAVRGCLGTPHGCFSSSKHSLHPLSSSRFPSLPGRSSYRCPISQPRRSRDLAKLCAGEGQGGRGAARSTWRWLWRRGESRRPGLCRDLPDPTATPTVPARPRAGTPRHSTHRSHQHPLPPPAPASWHRQPLPSPRRCQHPGVPASSQSTPPREMAAHIASKAQRFTTTGCITIFYR